MAKIFGELFALSVLCPIEVLALAHALQVHPGDDGVEQGVGAFFVAAAGEVDAVGLEHGFVAVRAADGRA